MTVRRHRLQRVMVSQVSLCNYKYTHTGIILEPCEPWFHTRFQSCVTTHYSVIILMFCGWFQQMETRQDKTRPSGCQLVSPLFCFCAALFQCTRLFCIHIKINFNTFCDFFRFFILLLLVFIKWNKTIHRQFFTTQKFIVNYHSVQPLLTLPTTIIR